MLVFWKKEKPFIEPENVPCDTCKLLVRKRDAQIVIHDFVDTEDFAYLASYEVYKDTSYYCPKHRKPYNYILEADEKEYFLLNGKLEVDKKGKPLAWTDNNGRNKKKL